MKIAALGLPQQQQQSRNGNSLLGRSRKRGVALRLSIKSACLFSSFLFWTAAGCSSDNGWMTKVGKNLDPVAQGLDEWGTSSISNPLLTTPDPKFSFDLNRTALDYYKDARTDINGGVGASEEQSSQETSGATLQANIDTMVKAALAVASGGAAAIPGVLQPTTAPAIATNVLPTTLPASNVLATEKFAALQSLLNNANPLVLDDRTAVQLAASNKATQDILAYLAGPTTAAKFKDKVVLFGTGMVSVQPGSRTSQHYASDLVCSVGYLGGAARTDILMQIPLADRLALYKRCLQKNWEDAFNAADAPETRVRTKEYKYYNQARVQYMNSLLYEARRLMNEPPAQLDLASLYKAFSNPDQKPKETGYELKPIVEPPTIPKDLISDVLELYTKCGGPIRVLIPKFVHDKLTGFEVDSEPLTKITSLIQKALADQQPGIAKILQAAQKTVQQQIDDAHEIGLSMADAGDSWTFANDDHDEDVGFEIHNVPPCSDGEGAFVVPLQITPKPLTATTNPATQSSHHVSPYTVGRYGGGGPKPWLSHRTAPTSSDDLQNDEEKGLGSPYIAAISPMTDSQVLDLRDSVRKQKEKATKIALALSFLGAQGQSQYFKDFVEKDQEDIATLSGDNVQIAYSTGDVFGFQISPRLKAVASIDESQKQKAAMILEPTSFPVLLVIGIDQEDIRFFPWKTQQGLYVPGENQIQFTQSTRWLPQKDPNVYEWWPWKSPSELTETTRAKWCENLALAQQIVDKAAVNAAHRGDQIWVDSFSTRIDALSKLATDDWNSQYTPGNVILSAYPQTAAPEMPAVMSVIPERIHVGVPVTPATTLTESVVIVGSGFKGLEPTAIKILPEGLDALVKINTTATKVGESSIQLQLLVSPEFKKPYPIYFSLTYKTDAGDKSALSPPVLLESNDSSNLSIVRTNGKNKDGTSGDRLQFSRDVDTDLLDRYLKGPEKRPFLWPSWMNWFAYPDRLYSHDGHQ